MGGMPMPMSPEQTVGKIIPQDELATLTPTAFPRTNAETALARVGGMGGAQGGGMFGQMHQAMIKVEEASVSFQLMVEVRNRLLESYQELMRMQV